MYAQASKGFTNATDAADYLVNKGLPFRSAHEVIGKLVLYCIQQNKGIEELQLNELKTFSKLFSDDIYESISLKTCVNLRNLKGGPSIEQTQQAIIDGKKRLKK
jgi:argininosuccinate lyase